MTTPPPPRFAPLTTTRRYSATFEFERDCERMRAQGWELQSLTKEEHRGPSARQAFMWLSWLAIFAPRRKPYVAVYERTPFV